MRREPVECEVGQRSAWFTGTPAVWRVLIESGVRHMRDPYDRRPTVPVQTLDDVLVHLELAGIPVHMVAHA